jgi:hypothetical protein
MDITKFIGAYSPEDLAVARSSFDQLAKMLGVIQSKTDMNPVEHGMRGQETIVRQMSSMARCRLPMARTCGPMKASRFTRMPRT